MPESPHPHETALKLRNFEIELFWKRSNYFLLLNSAIFIAFFSKDLTAKLLICAVGTVVCWYWYQTNLGSKFWQERWESAVDTTESSFYESNGDSISFFNGEDVKTVVDINLSKANSRWEKKVFKKQILKQPSVSFTMIKLSIFFGLVWLSLLGYEFYKLCTCAN